MLRQFYETRFGLFDHIREADARPLSTVALYDAEENGPTSLLYARINQYIKSDIYKYTGLNLNEFLSLPREIIQLLFKAAEGKARAEGQTLDGIQSQLDAMKVADRNQK